MISASSLRAAILLAFCVAAAPARSSTLDLSGTWEVNLDGPGPGGTWTPIALPGTLDDAQIGAPLQLKPALTIEVLARLQRKHTFIGPAWYRRVVEIPDSWRGKRVSLELERVMWASHVWVDGRDAGGADSLAAPHRYGLTAFLAPGTHTLLIRIDNREIHPGISQHWTLPGQKDAPLAECYTEQTQVIWNGVLGKLRLTATDPVAIDRIEVHPRWRPASLLLHVFVANSSGGPVRPTLRFTLYRQSDGTEISETTTTVEAAPGGSEADVSWPLSANASVLPWDEFSRPLYRIEGGIDGQKGGGARADFGFRDLQSTDGEFRLNGHRIFLRGDVEAAIYPLTGHPPMDVAAWKHEMSIAKEWGINHLRFHAWCPPEEAFEAADELGIYIQVEPEWTHQIGKNPESWAFMQAEADRILTEYGNHPSFMLYAIGTELEGNFSMLADMMRRLRAKDDRHLYTTSTFSFQRGHGKAPEPLDQFFITQRTQKGWIRGEGFFDLQPPSFAGDYSGEIAGIAVPVMTHELGQWCVFPDLKEIPRYTGNLAPLNFIAIRDDLARKGLLALAPQFTAASGRLAALLYKEDIERALRTPHFGGFQLLELEDYPGQGTSTVGLLNAFWDSKGILTPAQFRQFCSPLVPLALLPRAVYERGDTVRASVEVANFLHELPAARLRWAMRDEHDDPVASGTFGPMNIPIGSGLACGEIEVPIPPEGGAARWRLEVAVEGTNYVNRWSLWVYPRAVPPIPANVRFATSLEETLADLAAGDRVLFNPPLDRVRGVTGTFRTVFWSPVNFPNQPGTMGILCDPAHPALAGFPTEFHTDWQWWDPLMHSKSVIIDGLEAAPIIRVIDNFARNHSLANVFEARVGPGSLLFSAIDLQSDLDRRPVARQLRASLLRYASSSAFAPSGRMSPAELSGLISPAPLTAKPPFRSPEASPLDN